jgi:hypothetical protein
MLLTLLAWMMNLLLIDGEMQCSRATAVGEVEGLNTDCFRPILSMLLIIYTLVSPQIATLLLLY